MTGRAMVTSVCLLGMVAPALADDDPVKMNLSKAKSAYEAAMESYRQAVVAYFDKKEEEARKIGDKKLTDQLKVERRTFFIGASNTLKVPTQFLITGIKVFPITGKGKITK